MTPLNPIYIAGSDLGLIQNKKPFLNPDKAFTELENAYVWRDRVKKRECLELIGRLSRILTDQSLGMTAGGVTTYTFSTIFSTIGITGENPELEPGSLIITIAAPDAATFTDDGDGTFTVSGAGVEAGSSINYATGDVVIVLSASAGGAAITADFKYSPGLPAMTIAQREIAATNDEQTIFFDTKYAYINTGTDFQEFLTGTTWSGTDSDFYGTTNYRGILPQDRLFFVNNFVNNAANPIRYTDGSTWTSFFPVLDDNGGGGANDKHYLTQAKVLIPYYGRLLALNVYESPDAGAGVPNYASGVNIFNRCRFSQIGSPVAVDAWRSDQFGKGGFVDAPTNEAIISATFFKNTLLVGFERSTWQLRYVGEYGLPFIWERISSDFGTESQFSSILFDDGVLSVGDRAIISAGASGVQRADNQIPDTVFNFRNAENGLERVAGVRDFQRELVFWTYSDAQQLKKFPNRVLLFNYRNNTYAKFRDNVTCFGTFQIPVGITWDSLTTFWKDESVLWDDPDEQSLFPRIVCGNQQGYIHYYGYTTIDEPSLSISAIDLTADPFEFTVLDHNLEDGDSIYLTDLLFIDSMGAPTATNLNEEIYLVTVVDDDTITLSRWFVNLQQYASLNYTNFLLPLYPVPTPDITASYIGGGQITLLPKLYVETKDFNPYAAQGIQTKLSYIDFLMDATDAGAFSVEIYLNSSMSVKSNIITGNQSIETNLPANFWIPNSDYSWHRFFATCNGQFLRVVMTLSDDLMNDYEIHQQNWVMNAMTLWVRPGGRNPF